MQKNLGGWIIALLALTNIALWLITQPQSRTPELNTFAQTVGEIGSTTAMVLAACVLALSTRAAFLEPFFGGLDRMYLAHKRTALFTIGLLLGHALVMPRRAGLTLGPVLGVVGLTGMAALILLTLAPRLPIGQWGLRLPYHQWKMSHKFVGAFFLIGIWHTFNVEHLTQESAAVDLYARGLGFVGAAIYLYRVLLYDWIRPRYAYVVAAVRRLSGNTVEVSLAPQKNRLTHKAGQFLFIHFPKSGALSEPHPFTISSAPGEPNVRLSIKASGDFTQRLVETLQPETRAALEGPYGRLDYKTGARRQVWVAGGIGVTPFLSWLRDFRGETYEIHFFYTVRERGEALFWDEVEQAGRRFPTFKPSLICSNTDGRLSAEKIVALCGDLTQADVYLCGPLPMTESLRRGLMKLGVADARIHFEEFNFR